MDSRSGFQRVFLIFVNEDSGFEDGRKPSGHVRLETREGKGKLHATVQNLRSGNGRFTYKLYLIGNSRNGAIQAASAGQLTMGLNKSELVWDFDPWNVGATGCGINDLTVAAVVAEYVDRPAGTVICPLAAYKNNKVEWRSGLGAILLKKRMEEKAPIPADSAAQTSLPSSEPVQGIPGEVRDESGVPAADGCEPGITESNDPEQTIPSDDNRYLQTDSGQQFQATAQFPGLQQETWVQPDASIEDQSLWKCVDQQAQDVQPTQQFDLQEEEQYLRPAEEPYDIQTDAVQFLERRPEEQQSEEQPGMQSDAANGPLVQSQLTEAQPTEAQPEASQPTVSQPRQDPPQGQYPNGSGQVDTGCVYLNGNMCGAFVSGNTGAANPCDTCRMHYGQSRPTVQPTGDIEKLKEELVRYFEESNPFHIKRSDYTWWKVNNPVNLNNLLYQCNIRSPLLFNPAVMMAHYKYRHLIIGIFNHKTKQKQYVVCGVPGMHMVDRKPFGDMSGWVQAEGSRPKYGAFGYWLVYIDPDDGKILDIGRE